MLLLLLHLPLLRLNLLLVPHPLLDKVLLDLRLDGLVILDHLNLGGNLLLHSLLGAQRRLELMLDLLLLLLLLRPVRVEGDGVVGGVGARGGGAHGGLLGLVLQGSNLIVGHGGAPSLADGGSLGADRGVGVLLLREQARVEVVVGAVAVQDGVHVSLGEELLSLLKRVLHRGHLRVDGVGILHRLGGELAAREPADKLGADAGGALVLLEVEGDGLGERRRDAVGILHALLESHHAVFAGLHLLGRGRRLHGLAVVLHGRRHRAAGIHRLGSSAVT